MQDQIEWTERIWFCVRVREREREREMGVTGTCTWK